VTHDQVSGWAALIDKYGIAIVGVILMTAVVLWVLRSLIKGDLVPRSLYDREVEDNERMRQAIERLHGPIGTVAGAVNNIKKDEDRGG